MRSCLRTLALAITLATTASVEAAVVRLVPAGRVDDEPVTRLALAAAPGEANAITITVRRSGADRQGFPTVIVIEDSGAPLVAGRGCARIDDATASCASADELGLLRATLGDADDRAVVRSVSADQFIFLTVLGGGTGDDTLSAGDGGELTGGEGDDTLTGSDRYESLKGGPGADLLTGGGGRDYLDGGPGDDLLRGGAGNDTLLGSGGGVGAAGTDRLLGERGKDALDDGDADTEPAVIDGDVLDGGPGEDEVNAYLRRTAPVVLDLPAAIGGQAGEADALIDIERIFGGEGDDRITGDGDDNWLDGRDGRDEVTGGLGDDRLFGDDRDSIDGEDGDDALRPADGFTGSLACGPGADRVRIDVWPPAPADPRGLLIPADCEQLARGLHLVVRAQPAIAGPGALAFALETFRCCRQRLTVTTPDDPFGRIGAVTVRGPRAVVAVPPELITALNAEGAILRATVRTPDWTLAWRSSLGPTKERTS